MIRFITFLKEWVRGAILRRRASSSSKAENSPTDEAATDEQSTDADTSTSSEPTAPSAIPEAVGIEIQRCFNELRGELLDAREKTIDRWLTILGIAFPILALIWGFYSVKEFEEIKTQAQSYVEEIKGYRDKSEAHFQYMTAQRASEDLSSAIHEARDIRDNPKASPTDKAIAEAILLQEQGKREEALKIWRGIAGAFEEVDRELSARAYFSVGYLLIQQEKPEDAIAAYDEAIRLKPNFAGAYNDRGGAKNMLGRHEDAIADRNQAIRLKPDFAEAYSNRGLTKNDLGRHEDAITDYNRAIRLKPDLAAAYNNRGNAKGDLGRHEDAIADYDKAIHLKRDFAKAYNNRGTAKDELDRYEDAITDYDEAIRLKPDYAEAYFNRGNTKNTLRQIDEARQDFEKARDLAHRINDATLVDLSEKRLRDLDNQEGE